MMKDYELSEDTIVELKAAHKASKCARSTYVAYKIHVIILLGLGYLPSEVSEIMLLDEDTIMSYFTKYNSGGLVELLAVHYKGSNKKLTEEQIAILSEELDNNIYLTTKAVCRFVLIVFEIEYSERGMSRLLKSIGYVYKKPDIEPGNPDEELQDIFLQQYIDFLQNKPDDDLIFFMDAVHPVHNAQAAYGWFRKGEKRELKTNTGRDRYNIHGAMNADTYEVTAIFSEDNVNAESTIDLLKALEQQNPEAKRIFVLLDNARYHFSKIVQEFVNQSGKIKLVPIPPYSPELNLIERYWKVFKKEVIYNKHYPTFKEFKSACMDFFKLQHNHHDKIISIMGGGLLDLAWE